MTPIKDIADLEALYGTPGEASIIKVMPKMTPLYRRWIMESQFVVLSTAGFAGTDGSPRGDVGPVVQELDENTLLLPDWRGNNRMDTLRNIVSDGRISLMFMVQGSNNVVRVNGNAIVTTDTEIVERFEQRGQHPRSVIVISISEVYSQCARAVMRAGLWNGEDRSANLPSIGELLVEAKEGFDGASYDAEWPGRAAKSMW